MRRRTILRDFNMRRHFILTQPTMVDDVSSGYLEDEDYDWREKARKLQVRRWRKLRHHLV
jgi:hypothetical protein